MPQQFGYCCINNTLNKQDVTTGRTLRKATFQQDTNLTHTSSLALRNAQDLVKIIRWNIANDIHVFRIGSNIFPWHSEYKLDDLPDITEIRNNLIVAGALASHANMRLSFHPDHFVKLGSEKELVASRAIHDLEHHNVIFDIMGFAATHYNPLNIHVGMNYNPEVVVRFIDRFQQLNTDTKNRLVIENDDKANSFSVQQLYDHLFLRINTPITFDYFHHTFHPDGLSSYDAAHLAASTWDVKPLFHYSESKNLHEGINGSPRAHSDYAKNVIDDYGLDIDIDLEIKAKELGYFYYKEMYNACVS